MAYVANGTVSVDAVNADLGGAADFTGRTLAGDLGAGEASGSAAIGRRCMNLPRIDLSALPDLPTLTGMFGSLAEGRSPGHDDSIVILATFLYDAHPPGGGGLI